ncbi:MAG: RNA polymerase sigma factor [Candidatus Riflebacteria bacterium]|nr:RNA polymerase sigma factor [Candidatus Riflebacteria bacterium]
MILSRLNKPSAEHKSSPGSAGSVNDTGSGENQAETIEAALRGDISAFHRIYQAHARMVLNISWRIVNTREDAEEVAQDVFVSVFQKLGEFHGHSSLKTWIYRISVNCALNTAKKMAREKTQLIEYSQDLQTRRVFVDASGNEQTDDAYDIIHSMMSHLPPEQRACLVLRSVAEFSYQEIADILEANLNTVRSWLRRARETLLTLREKVVKHGL